MTIEHRNLRSEDPSRAADYRNLLYACTYCNQARGWKPLVERGVELLNPAATAWSEHFRLGDEYRLEPLQNDAAARRTARVYDLNEERRRKIRRTRDERLRYCLAQLAEIPAHLEWLEEQMRASNLRSIEQLRLARGLRRDLRNAVRELELYRAVPRDAPAGCACPGRRKFELPPGLRRQLIRIPSAPV
jgi:hypothetical protein